jgi:hypothetical protein
MKPIIATLGLVLGPAAFWWGVFLVGTAAPGGLPAEAATGFLVLLAGLGLISAGFAAFGVAVFIVLQPVVRYLETLLKADDAG